LLEDFDESPARSNDLAVIYTMLSVCHPPSFMNSTVSLGIKIGTRKKECKISTAIGTRVTTPNNYTHICYAAGYYPTTNKLRSRAHANKTKLQKIN
jgi:hypothetical protein